MVRLLAQQHIALSLRLLRGSAFQLLLLLLTKHAGMKAMRLGYNELLAAASQLAAFASLKPAVLLQASDGKRLAMLDEQGNLLKALAPPQFPRPAHRPCAVGPAYEVRAEKQNMASTCT
jgi:hypothetical protein